MANEEHLARLKQGVQAWNQWREANPDITPDLIGANLARTDLLGADLAGVHIRWTVFADVDLSMVQGLDAVTHEGPSTIGIDTLYRSHGNISEVFLRGAGVPDEMITYTKSLVGRPFEFYTSTFAVPETGVKPKI